MFMKPDKKGMIKKIIEKIIWSFDNTSSGFSSRKLSAFFANMIAAAVTVYNCIYNNGTIPDAVMYIVGIWLVYSLLCLGIITAEQVLRFKEGFSAEKNPEDDHGQTEETKPEDDETARAQAEMLKAQAEVAQAVGNEVKPEEKPGT